MTDRKLHIGGLTFHKSEKAWTTLAASDIDRIYGDAFCRADDAITGIGNNVTIEYADMDFGNETSVVIEITGRSPIAKNTIHVRTSNGIKEALTLLNYITAKTIRQNASQLMYSLALRQLLFCSCPAAALI